MGGGDKRGHGNESTRGTKTETGRSFTKEEGHRHEEGMYEQTVRKATRIRPRGGRDRLLYITNTRSKTSHTPGKPEPSDKAWQYRRSGRGNEVAGEPSENGTGNEREQSCTDRTLGQCCRTAPTGSAKRARKQGGVCTRSDKSGGEKSNCCNKGRGRGGVSRRRRWRGWGDVDGGAAAADGEYSPAS